MTTTWDKLLFIDFVKKKQDFVAYGYNNKGAKTDDKVDNDVSKVNRPKDEDIKDDEEESEQEDNK